MASFMDDKNKDVLIAVREYDCGCVIAADWAPEKCPFHGEPVYALSYAKRPTQESHVGWGGE